MSVPSIDPTLSVNLNANLMNNAISTLQGLNQARKGFLDNQALQQTVPLAGQQAKAGLEQTQAQTGLLGAQTKAAPYNAVGALLNGIGKSISATQPFSYLRNAPDQFKDVATANQIQGKPNVGNVAIPDYSPVQNKIQNLIGSVLNNQGVGANQPAQTVSSALGSGGVTNPSLESNMGQSLPLSPEQIQRTGQFFGNNQVSKPVADEQAQKLASNLEQTAQNKVASPQLVQKANYAFNLMSTLSKYGNPAITFAQYMGPVGYKNYLQDLGKQSPDALNFRSFLREVAPFAKDQARQFLSSSVQPTATQELHDLINPQSLTAGAPGAAKAYDDLMDIMRQEGGQAAKTAGLEMDFDKKFPASTAEDYLNNVDALNQKGSSGKTYFKTLPLSTQIAVNRAHQARKGTKNG